MEHKRPSVHLVIRSHSSINRTRKPKERDDLVHLLRQVHRTEIQKVTEKVAMTEVPKAHQNLLVKVSDGKRTDKFVQTSRKEVAKGKIHETLGNFPNGTIFKAPAGCRFGDKCAYKHTAKPADERGNSASIAIIE